jgi:hypothetical protein
MSLLLYWNLISIVQLALIQNHSLNWTIAKFFLSTGPNFLST